MNMVKKLLNSKTIVTIIALVVCAIIILWAYTSRVNKKINKVTIPVAKELINAREEIILGDSKKDIKTILTIFGIMFIDVAIFIYFSYAFIIKYDTDTCGWDHTDCTRSAWTF